MEVTTREPVTTSSCTEILCVHRDLISIEKINGVEFSFCKDCDSVTTKEGKVFYHLPVSLKNPYITIPNDVIYLSYNEAIKIGDECNERGMILPYRMTHSTDSIRHPNSIPITTDDEDEEGTRCVATVIDHLADIKRYERRIKNLLTFYKSKNIPVYILKEEVELIESSLLLKGLSFPVLSSFNDKEFKVLVVGGNSPFDEFQTPFDYYCKEYSSSSSINKDFIPITSKGEWIFSREV